MRQLRLLLLSCGLALGMLLAFTALAGQAAASVPSAVKAAFSTPRATYPIADTAAITNALTFLGTAQRADGGFAGFTPGQSDDFTTIKVALALNVARLPADTLTSSGGQSALDYLATRAYSYTHDLNGLVFPGRLGLLTLAVVAGEADAAAFGAYPPGQAQAGQPLDLIGALSASYQPATGAYSTTAALGFSSGAAGAINQTYALLGLAAAQQSVPPAALSFLRDQQEADGGWGFGFGGDVDTTALALQALIANGVAPTDAAIQRGLGFLRGQQLADGAWGFEGTPSADATAFVIQAAAAAGFSPVTASWATAGGNPQTALAALQLADGSFGGNALGTAHAIAGLAEAPLPLLGRVQRAQRALAAISATQGASGGWSFFGSPSVGGSLDAILAFGAAGYNPANVSAPGGASALDFLASEVFTYTHDSTGTIFPAQTGKAILGIVAAGADPASFGARPGGGTLNLVGELTASLDATGAYSTTAVGAFTTGAASPLSQALAILGLRAAGQPIPDDAVAFLRRLKAADGSWGSVDTTSLVIQALRAAGVAASDPDLIAALTFLRAQQDALGGWGNPNSTAYAIQALVAAGADIKRDWLKGGRSPYEALALYQRPDGSLTYTWEAEPFFTPGEANALATWQAVPALRGVAFPVQPGALTSYTPVIRGPNPDRLVVGSLTGRWGNSIAASLPFGSDLNGNAGATLEWRPLGATDWTTATLVRGDGVFTATLAVTGSPQDYELRAVLSDPDAVQSGASLAPTATLSSTVAALRTYLPLVSR